MAVLELFDMQSKSSSDHPLTRIEQTLPQQASERPAARDNALDFTMGTLVLFMVLYHWCNYFLGPLGRYYDYLRFLTPSFIFITGFMISYVHMPRYGADGWSLPQRLAVRGLKLIGIFVGLNILMNMALSGCLVRSELPEFLVAAFVTGKTTSYGGQKSMAFNILVLIAYLLILSSGVLFVTRFLRYAFHGALGVFMAAAVVLSLRDVSNMYAELLMIGLLGGVIGTIKRERIARIVSRPALMGLLYCALLTVISFTRMTAALQTTSVVLTVLLLYMAGSAKQVPSAVRRAMILFGKYLTGWLYCANPHPASLATAGGMVHFG